jgi:hypothetical protein
VHLHACVTDGVFVPAAAEAARDTPPAFLPAASLKSATCCPDTKPPTGSGLAAAESPRGRTDWGQLVQLHDDRDVLQAAPDELPAIDIHSL